jgi:hypothetical protein
MDLGTRPPAELTNHTAEIRSSKWPLAYLGSGHGMGLEGVEFLETGGARHPLGVMVLNVLASPLDVGVGNAGQGRAWVLVPVWASAAPLEWSAGSEAKATFGSYVVTVQRTYKMGGAGQAAVIR